VLLATFGSNRTYAQLKLSDHVFAEPGISVATYIDRLKHGTTEWQQYNAAAALGELDDKSAIPALVEALENPNEAVRENAVSSLGDLGAVNAIPAIRKLLRDPSPDVRTNAANSLAELGAVESITDIASLFNDVSPNVRASARAAVQYLEAQKGESAR
jgi:HEAT repeat protein